ncbi:hypothetical protein NEOC65_001283 [Neochlamydia sp. AcF65]|nr:hypothetical protein [Neochlamydia sp. AcF65]
MQPLKPAYNRKNRRGSRIGCFFIQESFFIGLLENKNYSFYLSSLSCL